MIGFQPGRSSRGTRSRKIVFMALVCLALLALLTVVQVAHVHTDQSDADHCPLCIVLHSAAPIAVTVAMIVLVEMGVPTPPDVECRTVSLWYSVHVTRPPPAAC